MHPEMTTNLHLSEATLSEPSAPVSVVILTKDEAINIVDCLASCAWCDDVHVLDSYSDDNTVELARAANPAAGIHQRAFTTFGDHRNWAIDHIPVKYPWVFHLDADERFTPELVQELAETAKADNPHAGYYVAGKYIFMGQWLKRTMGFPNYQMRFFHNERMRFTDYGHGQREQTDGRVGTLQHAYLHYGVSKGIEDWLAKHNRYSTQEAERALEVLREPVGFGDLFKGSAIARRRVLKRLAYHVPCRAWARWFWTLWIKGGISEGAAARTYTRMLMQYEQMIALKLKLLRRQAKGQLPGDTRIAPPPK